MSTSPNAMARWILLSICKTLFIFPGFSLSSEMRDCYGEDEISLTFLPRHHGFRSAAGLGLTGELRNCISRYEMSNCLFEATFEQILESCQCAPGFHTMGGDEALRKYEICQGKSLNCMNNILNRMGEFDEVHVEGGARRQRCRAACEDQINSMFITTSNYPNRETFQHQEEFCLITNRLISKCSSHKRGPLMRKYPGLCPTVEPLGPPGSQCGSTDWRTAANCSSENCPLADQVYQYAKDNFVLFNTFIKDPYGDLAVLFSRHTEGNISS